MWFRCIIIIFSCFPLSIVSCFSKNSVSQAKSTLANACDALSKKDPAKALSAFESLVSKDYHDRLGDKQKLVLDIRELFFSSNHTQIKRCRFVDTLITPKVDTRVKQVTISGIIELETTSLSETQESALSSKAELYFYGQMETEVILTKGSYFISENFLDMFREAYHLMQKRKASLEKKDSAQYLSLVSPRYDFNGKTFEDIKKKITSEFSLEREIQITTNRLEIRHEEPYTSVTDFFSLQGIVIDDQVIHRGKGSYLLQRETQQSQLKIVGGIY